MAVPEELKRAIELEEDTLLACVHCGLCLPHCPTYSAAGDENDSPRGRLWLMRAVAEGRLDPNDPYTEHIEGCIVCRACETACPSGVRYGHVMGVAREDLRDRGLDTLGPVARFIRWAALKFVLPHQLIVKLVNIPMSLVRRMRPARGWPATLPRFVRVGLEMLPPPPVKRQPVRQVSAATGAPGQGRRVVQFRGCLMDEMFRDVNEATTRILKANGFAVDMPKDQGCCGALHDHAGDLDHTRRLARNNIDALEDGSDTPIIVNAAGCGAILKEYGELLADDPDYAERAERFSARVKDATEFLAGEAIVSGAPIPYKVTFDAPCHLYHAQRVQKAPLEMLRAIPDLDFVPLRDADRCCGSGGIYNLTQPDLSDEVLRAKIDAVAESGAGLVLTANPGCQMQILAGVRMEGLEVEVRHILDLLDESYAAAGLYEK